MFGILADDSLLGLPTSSTVLEVAAGLRAAARVVRVVETGRVSIAHGAARSMVCGVCPAPREVMALEVSVVLYTSATRGRPRCSSIRHREWKQHWIRTDHDCPVSGAPIVVVIGRGVCRIADRLDPLARAIDEQLGGRSSCHHIDLDLPILGHQLAVPSIIPYPAYGRCVAPVGEGVLGCNRIAPPSPVPPRATLFKPGQIEAAEIGVDGWPALPRFAIICALRHGCTQRRTDQELLTVAISSTLCYYLSSL